MISNCSHDENGKYTNGKAGDQYGNEWQIRTWYNRPWTCVIRFNNKIRKKIALNAKRAANNNHIGYDQNQRTTFWTQLEKASFDASKIKINCETDCSAGVSALIKAAGYLLDIDELKSFSVNNTTRTLKEACRKVGARILTDKKYLQNDDYLLKGDIILCEGHHVTTNLTNGSKIKTDKEDNTDNTIDTVVKNNTPTYNVGKTYTLQVELNVRKGAGIKYSKIPYNGLTDDAKKHDKDKDGALNKGTRVTCKAVKKVGNDIWMQIPSGWIAAYYNGNVYVK